MAIAKAMELENGVTVRYHRVVSITTVVNLQTTIEVRSYTTEGKRAEEKAASSGGEFASVYTRSRYHVVPYDGVMTVEGAYAAVKAMLEYVGATDVWEEGQGA